MTRVIFNSTKPLLKHALNLKFPYDTSKHLKTLVFYGHYHLFLVVREHVPQQLTDGNRETLQYVIIQCCFPNKSN